MTDFPISHLPSANSTGNVATAIARLNAMFRTALDAGGRAITLHGRRRALRSPEEILMAQVRRQEARRAVDRLLR